MLPYSFIFMLCRWTKQSRGTWEIIWEGLLRCSELWFPGSKRSQALERFTSSPSNDDNQRSSWRGRRRRGRRRRVRRRRVSNASLSHSCSSTPVLLMRACSFRACIQCYIMDSLSEGLFTKPRDNHWPFLSLPLCHPSVTSEWVKKQCGYPHHMSRCYGGGWTIENQYQTLQAICYDTDISFLRPF